jgi:hypothetical protein
MKNEPLHERIKKYRILHIIVILFLIWLTADVWEYIKLNLKDLETAQAAAITGIFSSLVGGLFVTSKDSKVKIEIDDK